jgi:hypothetical protein
VSVTPAPARAIPAAAPAVPRLTLARTFLAAVAVAFVGAALAPVGDPDFWWHLKTGQWIWAHGAIPHHDLYTYTVSSHPWVAHEWLSELLLAAFFWAGHLPAVSIALGAVTLAGFYWIFQRIDRPRVGFLAAGVATALGVFAGGPIWGPRFQMITFALSALLLLWIARFCEGRGRALYYFPLLMVLWVNLHGGFIVAYAFLGLTLLAELLRYWLRAPGALGGQRLQHLALIFAASIGAAIFNPNTYRIYLYPFQTQGSGTQQSVIVEWFSPNFHNKDLLPFELMLFTIIALLPLARRVPLRELFFFLSTLALALQSQRHIALFVVGATPLLALLMQAAWERAVAARGWRVRWVEPAFPAAGPLNAALLALVALLVLSFTGLRVLPRQVDGDAIRKDYPVAAADFVLATRPPGHLFNEYGWGGYLVWRLQPDYPVYIYGDAALMGDAFLSEYDHVETVRPDFREILDRRQVDWVIFRSGGAIVTALLQSPDLVTIFKDKTATIVMRRSTASSDYLAAHALP